MKKCLYLIAFVLIISLKIDAQNSINQTPDTVKFDNTLTWVNFGIGGLVTKNDDLGMFTSSINISFQKKKHIVIFKPSYSWELWPGYTWMGRGTSKLTSFDLMYGFIYKKPIWNCSISSGIDYSFLSDWNYDGNEHWLNVRTNKLGIPIDIQIFMTGKRIGIGLDGFLIFNKEFATYGAQLCLQLGKLR